MESRRQSVRLCLPGQASFSQHEVDTTFTMLSSSVPRKGSGTSPQHFCSLLPSDFGRTSPLVAVAVALVFAAATIFAVHNDGLFELGTPPYGAGSGDIAGSAAQSGPDWGDLFTSTGAFKDVIGVAGRPDYKDYGGIGADLVKD